MAKTFQMIFRGPLWVPFLVALLLAGTGLVLRYGFILEASSFARLAETPLPKAVAVNHYQGLRDSRVPHEAVLRAQVLIKDQIVLADGPGGGATSFFLPFTTPPGQPEAGKILGGMVLSKQGRDAFVQWAVTQAHPRLGNLGIEMMLVGLVERPALAGDVRAGLAAKGLTMTADPVFLTPYMGRRAAVLRARFDGIADNPVTWLFFLISVVMFLFGVSRYERQRPKWREPEPLKDEALRNTAFAVLVVPEPDASALVRARPPLAERAARAQARAQAMSASPRKKLLLQPWVRESLRLLAIWTVLAFWGWLLSEAFPIVLGDTPKILGALSMPLGMASHRGLRRLMLGSSLADPLRGLRWESATLRRRLAALRQGRATASGSGGSGVSRGKL